MKILFIADPMVGFKTYKDTTYAMMREMANRGWVLHHTLAGELSIANGLVLAQASAFEFIGAKDKNDQQWFQAQTSVQVALNEFDAVRDGTFSEFKSFYSGNANAMNKYVNLNLLSLSMVNDKNEEEKLKIINFLISEGVDINFQDCKFKRNGRTICSGNL